MPAPPRPAQPVAAPPIAVIDLDALRNAVPPPELNRQRQARRAELQKSIRDAYEKVGKRNPKWDAAARAALDGAVTHWLHPKTEMYSDALWLHAKKAVDAGCDDPFIKYLYARFHPGPFKEDGSDQIALFRDAAEAMSKSGYSAGRCGVAAAKLANIALWPAYKPSNTTQGWCSELAKEVSNALPVAAREKGAVNQDLAYSLTDSNRARALVVSGGASYSKTSSIVETSPFLASNSTKAWRSVGARTRRGLPSRPREPSGAGGAPVSVANAGAAGSGSARRTCSSCCTIPHGHLVAPARAVSNRMQQPSCSARCSSPSLREQGVAEFPESAAPRRNLARVVLQFLPMMDPSPVASADAAGNSLRPRLGMALAALGVVYGDLGTSPLYAFRECVRPESGGVLPTAPHVLGVLSLIFWALTLIVSLKYLTVVLQADNNGEGGILALLALLLERKSNDAAAPTGRFDSVAIAALLGIIGTALLLADGMITPAISVLSALEGLELAAPQLDAFVVPLTVAILIALFATQRLGTAWIARFFGPVMLVWFLMIALMGLPWIARCPEVLAAVDPRHGLNLFLEAPVKAFLLLGSVVLCVTGAEALYADLGHFGKGPIRLAWYGVVFPSLLLNYFGQGALVISRGGDIVATNPQGAPATILIFFHMVPEALLYPVLIVSTLATVIASQALISGAFSLAEQAVQLEYWPRLAIVHTSGEMKGRIYVPFVNWALMIACILLVIEFKTSSNLAAAYGIAVIGTMTITSVLLFQVMRACWGWSLAAAGALIGLFLAVDVPFLLANLGKVASGGWVPLLAAAALFTVMTTWRRGRAILDDPGNTESFRFPMKLFMAEMERAKPKRDQETVVFLTSSADMVPMALTQLVERTHMLPGTLVLLSVRAEPMPRVRDNLAIQIRPYGQNCYGVTARYGYLQRPDMARLLALCSAAGLKLDIHEVYFYLSRMTITPTGRTPLAQWRKKLFAFMYHNSRPATSFYNLPPNRVVELGRVIEV